ncbi:MAG: T9SS type A sorting domain-containing protein [Bacteroidales bacterium]
MSHLKYIRLIYILLAVAGFTQLAAQNYYTVQDGNWKAKSTWQNKNDPGTGWIGWKTDTIFINHNITLNQNLAAGFVLVISNSGSLSGNADLTTDSDGELIADSDIEVKNLTLNNFQSITINNNLTVSENLTIYGGSSDINIGGDLYVGNNFTNNSGNTSLILNGLSTIDGDVTMSNNAPVKNNGDLTINGTTTIRANSGIINSNTLTTNGTVSNEGTIDNSGTFYANQDFTNAWGGQFINSGTFVAQQDVTNQGTLDNTNTMEVNGDMKNDWSSDINNDGIVTVDGSVDNNGDISGSGSTLVGGTLDTSDGSVQGSGNICSQDGTTDPTGGNTSNVDSTVSICGQTDDPLPVELIDFNVKETSKGIKLTWTTASEINNDYFTVQRATENSDFKSIATIEGAGNSNEIINYTYIDDENINGKTVYYRIKQTDYDGTTSYSWIEDISTQENITLKVFPNPVKYGEEFTIQSSEKNNKVTIYNSSGQQVFEKEINKNKTDIDSYNLSKGINVIYIKNYTNNTTKTHKIIVQ